MFDKAPFKTGQLVQVSDKKSIFYGEIGRIRSKAKRDGTWIFLLHMSHVAGTPEIAAQHLERLQNP